MRHVTRCCTSIYNAVPPLADPVGVHAVSYCCTLVERSLRSHQEEQGFITYLRMITFQHSCFTEESTLRKKLHFIFYDDDLLLLHCPTISDEHDVSSCPLKTLVECTCFSSSSSYY